MPNIAEIKHAVQMMPSVITDVASIAFAATHACGTIKSCSGSPTAVMQVIPTVITDVTTMAATGAHAYGTMIDITHDLHLGEGMQQLANGIYNVMHYVEIIAGTGADAYGTMVDIAHDLYLGEGIVATLGAYDPGYFSH